MDILKNPNIKDRLAGKTYYNLDQNNQRLNVIVALEDNPLEKLKEIFNKLVTEEKIENGYYQLQNLFTLAMCTKNQDAIINLIVDVVDKKIKTIHETIHNEDGGLDPINLSMYIQLWKSYREFTQKIYHIVNHYQHYLVEKKIKMGKISYDVLSVVQICMFYDNIIGKNSANILSMVSDEISDIDKKNIDQLIDYIDSIRTFIIMKEFTTIDKDKLVAIIRNIMTKVQIVNIMCSYMNTLLRNLTNKQAVLDETEYETVNSINFERTTIRKIYKIATILSSYAEKKVLLPCYSKFMQARIIDPRYDNLELDIELVRRISGVLGKEESQKLIDTISDVINSRKANELIHDAEVKITSAEYQKLPQINTEILNPVILTKNAWKIYNITDLELNYPLEMKCYLEMISKSYHSLYNGEFVIDWQPTMGRAQFEAQLGTRCVDITCNILQAMVMIYLNDNPATTVAQFSRDTYLNRELAAKVFKSLFEENIIFCPDDQAAEPVYMVNSVNYTGESKLDIRRSFMEVFEVETDAATSTKPKMDYRVFMFEEIKRLNSEKPGLKNGEYRKMAMEKWRKYEKQMAKKDMESEDDDEVEEKTIKSKAKYVEDESEEDDDDEPVARKGAKKSPHPSAESDSDEEEEEEPPKPAKKASPAKKKVAPRYESDSESDSEDEAPKRAAKPKSAYQIFVADAIQRLRQKHPGLSNVKYLTMAAQEWKAKKAQIEEESESE